MNAEELFVDGHKLPRPLNKKEVYELLEKIRMGDKAARDKLVYHNIRLVLYQVMNRFKTVKYDQQELVSVGNIGLLKAVDNFNVEKGVEFATYASRCIDNEILMFLRKIKNDQITASLDTPINIDGDGNEQMLSDIISDNTDIEGDYINDDVRIVVRSVVEQMQGRDREIVKLYFGFYNEKEFTQREIAEHFNISQSYVSRLVKKLVRKLGIQLQSQGIVEGKIENNRKVKCQSDKKEGKVDMGKQLQSIYDYFKNYSKEQINEMLLKLTEEERELIKLRYGADLENPVSNPDWAKENTNLYYGSLVPKMKRLLANPINERKPRGRRPRVKGEAIITVSNVSSELKKAEANKAKTSIVTEATSDREIVDQKVVANEVITKEFYIKMLEFLKGASFSNLLSDLNPKEAVIVSLKLGYVDGKCFSNSAIAQFLEIDNQEVINIVTKVLVDYKNRINQSLDEFIKIVTSDQQKCEGKDPLVLKN